MRNGIRELIVWLFFGLFCAANALAELPVKKDCSSMKGEVVYFGPREATALLGIKHGLNRSGRSGCHRQVKLNLKTRTETEILTFKKPKPIAIFAAADAETLRLLSMMNGDVPVFNLTEDYDDLRALCLPNLLHIVPSSKMKEDAVSLWHKQPVAEEATAYAWLGDKPTVSIKILNDAFQSAQGKAMDESSWSGWIASSALLESIAKVNSLKPDVLVNYLRNELRFEAEPGIILSFRPNGQLRQPLQMAARDKWVGTVPSSPQPTEADLDRLGPGYCPKPLQPGPAKTSEWH